jgi:hypothetical protein
MDIQVVIISQYLAALEMLKGALEKCPDEIWSDPADKNKFWQIAYHALFYTHFYLEDSEETFSPWREEISEPYDQGSLLEYLAFCRQQVKERVPLLDLEGESGFDWLPFNKLELQFYNIRHIQQHAGELMERLGTRAGLELDWVGMVYP